MWGHGSYVSPAWSADWPQREAVALRELVAVERLGLQYDVLTPSQKAAVDADVKAELRVNTYDDATKTITVSPLRANHPADRRHCRHDLVSQRARRSSGWRRL